MEYTFQESQFDYLQLCTAEWLRQEETAELIVPDSSPDAVGVVDSFAVVCVRSVECREGSILISGGIQAGVLYQAENQSLPRLLETYLPFTMRKDIASCEEETSALISCSLVGCDARILNSRKIFLRTDLGCRLELYQKGQCRMYQPEQQDDDLQLLVRSDPVRLCRAVEPKLFAIEETLDLPAGHIPMEQIVRCRPQAQVLESRCVGNKVIFKGNVTLDILYMSLEEALERWTLQVPFSQFCDLPCDCDEAQTRIILQLSGCDVRLEQQDQISVELMYQIQCQVDEAFEIAAVADAYHLKGTMSLQRQQTELSAILQNERVSQTLRLQGKQPMQAVLDTQIILGKPDLKESCVQVPLTAKIIGTDMSGQYVHEEIRGTVEYSHSMGPDARCFAEARLSGDVYAIPGSAGADLRLAIETDMQWYQSRQLETVCGGTVTEETGCKADRPSLILRRVTTDTQLWDLAKSAGTTAQRIRSANHLQNDIVSAGSLVLIPLR